MSRKNDFIYVAVPLSDLNQSLINRSTSAQVNDVPILSVSGNNFGILKIPKKAAYQTDLYDNYRWRSAEEAIRFIRSRRGNPPGRS